MVKQLIHNNKGFSLIELMATIAILSLITLIAVPVVGNIVDNAESDADEISASMIENAARTARALDIAPDRGNGYSVQALVDEGLLSMPDDSPFNHSSAYVERAGYNYMLFSENGIAGRNLLHDSQSYHKSISDTHSTYNQMWRISLNSLINEFNVGDDIAISFDVQMQRGEYLRIYDTNNSGPVSFGSVLFRDIGPERQRIEFTRTVTQGKGIQFWHLDFYNNNNGDKFIIENVQVEKGSKATPYRQAPEDFNK